MKPTRGSALLLTTILMFIILSMVVSLTYVTVMEQKMSQKTKSSVGAFYGAESGVEWALNKIATSDGAITISTAFSTAWNDTTDVASCPFGGCSVYLLKADGNVITDGSTYKISDIKAVRSVGTQGTETQRAIEAAVATTGVPGDNYTAWGLVTCASNYTAAYTGVATVFNSAGSSVICSKELLTTNSATGWSDGVHVDTGHLITCAVCVKN
jgi:hypothetical protein